MALAQLAPYRGRFAPTPSGPLHFGSLVAAAGSFLEARAHGGEWHVRIDDLDAPRVAEGATSAILRCLEAFGFEWDGAVTYQSRRRDAYHAALHCLRERGPLYPCACSRREIAASGLVGTEGPIYPGTCRGGLPPDRPARALRLQLADARVQFEDGLLGPQSSDLARAVGDFPLYRADGVYSFHLASAVDDGEMGMTDIVRGADLLPSSACQMHLLCVLGYALPRYVHLPVAVDANGEKLSKQTHAPALDVSQPMPALRAVARFLNQDMPAANEAASPAEFWRCATVEWSLPRIGARLQALYM